MFSSWQWQKKNLGNFDERSDEVVLLGYALDSKAYRVYNKKTMCIKESIHIIFDETHNFVENVNDGCRNKKILILD